MRHRNYSELRARMTPERRGRNDQAAREELREMLLSELRRAAGKTQVELAAAMGIQQPNVSKLESQDDMQISTLRQIVEALGGQLEIIARLPGESVALRLSEFRK
jgi:transcriptional regulator with XRE-family HTH domain